MNDSDPFEHFYVDQQKQQQQSAPQAQEDDPFSQFYLDKSDNDDSPLKYILRQGGRSASRVLEQIGGLPQEAKNIASMVVDPLVESLFGKELAQKTKDIQEQTRVLPTSKELKAASIKASKGFTEPKNKGEEIGDEYAELVGQLIGPMKFRKALGIAALGTAAKEGTKVFGLGEGTQEAAKLGTTLIASMFNPKGVKNLWKGYYDEATKHITPSAMVSANPLQIKLNILENELLKGIGAPSESAVLKVINDVKGKINNGQIGVDEAVAAKRSLNEIMGDTALLERGRTLFTKVGNAIDGTIKLYQNPDFIKNFRAANEAFGGYAKSRKLSNWLNRMIGGKPVVKALFAAGAEAAGGHLELVAPTLGIAGVAGGLVKGAELMQRIMSNKTLRKYYLDMLINGMKENTRGAIASASKLEKGLDEK